MPYLVAARQLRVIGGYPSLVVFPGRDPKVKVSRYPRELEQACIGG